MKNLKYKLYWIVPIILAITIISILFSQNLKTVAESPSDDWGRRIQLGETDIKKLPRVFVKSDGDYEISILKEGQLAQKLFSPTFELKDEKVMEVPFSKWDAFYLNGDTLIYHMDDQIFHHQKDEVIADATEMYVDNEKIFYNQENQFYQLDPQSMESKKLGEIPELYNTYTIVPNEDTPTIGAYKKLGDRIHLGVFQYTDGKLQQPVEQLVKVNGDESITGVELTSNKDQFALVLRANVDQPGKDTIKIYTSVNDLSNSPIQLKNFVPLDPVTGQELMDLEDIEASFIDNQLSLLFNAYGFTKVDYKENYKTNIYQVMITDQEKITAKRRSNTYHFSTSPNWVNESTIMWMDFQNPNPVYVSSSDPEIMKNASGYNNSDLVIASGATMNMLIKTIPALILAYKWVIWPLLFFTLLFLFYKRSLDYNYNWVLYAGLMVYVLATFVFNDLMFVRSVIMKGPEYLTFDGSPYVLLTLFSIIAYLCMQFLDRATSAGYKVLYFVIVHLMLVSLVVGPYIL